MAIKKKVTISWSGGKDSAFALWKILQSAEFEVTGLHTVIDKESRRVGMHGIPEELVVQQADAIGLPISKIYLEGSEDHRAYGQIMKEFYQQCADSQIAGVVFGDIFLEDLKLFRESLLNTARLEGIFPLWKRNTDILIDEFIDAGFKTLICAADAKHFAPQQVGKTIDKKLVNMLTADVDACGENGEFHTFVYDAPFFKNQVRFQFGEIVKKSYCYKKINDDGSHQSMESSFWFQDLLPLIA